MSLHNKEKHVVLLGAKTSELPSDVFRVPRRVVLVIAVYRTTYIDAVNTWTPTQRPTQSPD